MSAHSIPRATAKRLIARYQKTLKPQGNCLSESIPEPEKAVVAKLFEAVWPRLRKVLTAGESVIQFIGCIVTASGVPHEWREEGLVIFNPVPKVVDELPGSTSATDPTPQPFGEACAITEEPPAEVTMAAPATEVLAEVVDDHAEKVA